MFERYAIFFTPTGALADFGAAWLGWDSAKARAVPHPVVDGIDVPAITAIPRKYGFHATLSAPFRLAPDSDPAHLHDAVMMFSRKHTAFDIGTMVLRQDHGFVALRPQNTSAQLQNFAATIVRAFAPYRAALSDTEIAHRRRAALTARQDQQLLQWGYPYIFDDFHFHMTLSGPLPPDTAKEVITAITPRLIPLTPTSLRVDAITLMGQDAEGMFHQIRRHALTG